MIYIKKSFRNYIKEGTSDKSHKISVPWSTMPNYLGFCFELKKKKRIDGGWSCLW